MAVPGRTVRGGALALALIVVASGCGDGGRPTLTDDTPAPRACSADSLRTTGLDPEGLTAEVASTRQGIVAAATECDYDALIRLGAAGPVSVTLDGAEVPVTDWERREAEGVPILRSVAGILGLAPAAPGTDGSTTWPSAVDWPFSDVAPGDERRALADVVGEQGIFGWRETGGYAGWRTTIAADGTWTAVTLGPTPG